MNKTTNIGNTSSKKSQQGMTMISMMIIIVFLLFQAVIAMNVIPVYMTDSSVKNVMEGLPTDSRAQGVNAKELKGIVIKDLSMNSVYAVKAENIKVKKGRGEYVVTINYEPRGKLIGNLEYIVNFTHEARVPTR